MSPRLTRERMLDALEAQAGLVRFTLADPAADPAAPVPSCPDWNVRDLVAHLGAANWWGGANVRDRNPDERSRGLRAVMESAPPAGDGGPALADWYAGLTGELLDTLTDADPDAPAWTFAGPGRAVYWLRRMVHETAIHRWDLENALGGPAATTPLPEDVAVDTVDEFCTAIRPLAAVLRPEPQVTLRLRAVLHGSEGLASGAEPAGAVDPGTDLEWEVPGADDAPEAGVAGPPEALALLLWGRAGADADGIDVTGDRPALDATLEAGLST